MTEKITVPAASQRAKMIIEELTVLFDERRVKASRLRDGVLYLQREISKKDAANGVATAVGIIKDLEVLDLKIRDLQTEFTIAAEALYSDVSFDIKVRAHEGDIGVVPSQKLSFGTGDLVDISPEDIWFIQIASKLFGSTPSDLRFGSQT